MLEEFVARFVNRRNLLAWGGGLLAVGAGMALLVNNLLAITNQQGLAIVTVTCGSFVMWFLAVVGESAKGLLADRIKIWLAAVWHGLCSCRPAVPAENSDPWLFPKSPNLSQVTSAWERIAHVHKMVHILRRRTL